MTDPNSPERISTRKILWASVWPLFALSLLASLALGRNVGLGGLGSIVVGTFMASRFAARPANSFSEA